MIEPVRIKNRTIGKGNPIFLIAEMACSHQGSVNQACELVNVAIKSEADAIQLQVFDKEDYMSPICEKYDLISQLELSQNEWSRVIDLIKKSDKLFFATAFDRVGTKFLIEKKVDAFKIHTSDISNPEVLIDVAESEIPVFLSCGASKIGEIKKAIEILKENGTKDIVLMHGYQGFPTKIEETHLNYIKTLERLFGFNVGFYDHVDGGSKLATILPMLSIGYGAKVIEKHYTLSRAEKGIDYESSLEPDVFIEFCKLLRDCEIATGSKGIRDFTDAELKYRATYKKSIVAKTEITKGTKITRDCVMFVRNTPEIPPDEFNEIEGKISKRKIKIYHNLTYDDF